MLSSLGIPNVTAIWVFDDAGLLRILLRNLIDNAIRYSPDSSLVRVELGRSGGRIRLAVIDQGPGLTPEQREQAWQRFYRILGSNTAGSGLGLSIVKRIAEIHQTGVTLDAGDGGHGLCATLVFEVPDAASNAGAQAGC